ncbi:hypothetical protein ACMFMG_001636 [Clarireedia jacksonii]
MRISPSRTQPISISSRLRAILSIVKAHSLCVLNVMLFVCLEQPQTAQNRGHLRRLFFEFQVVHPASPRPHKELSSYARRGLKLWSRTGLDLHPHNHEANRNGNRQGVLSSTIQQVRSDGMGWGVPSIIT